MISRQSLLLVATLLHAAMCFAGTVPEVTPEYGSYGDGIARERIQPANGRDAAYVGHALPDGRLLLGGVSSQLGTAATSRFAFLRLTAQGQRDPSFGIGGSGSFVLDIAAVGEMTAMSTTSSGKILFAGSNQQHTGIVGKVGENGAYDSIFGQNGKRYIGPGLFYDAAISYAPLALVPLRSGALLVVGIATNGESACAGIALLTEAGNFDPTLGGDGTICLAPARTGVPLAIGTDAFELDNGQILVSGGAFHAGGAGFDMFVARIDPDGSLDASFGTNASGFAIVDFDRGSTLNDLAHAIDVDAEGRIVIAGQVNIDSPAEGYDMGAARLTSAGVLDSTFGASGRVVLSDAVTTAFSRNARDVVILEDGRMLISGFTEVETTTSTAIMLRDNGALDTGFGSGGVLLQAPPGSPRDTVVSAKPHTAVLAGDHFYFIGGIQFGAPDPIFGYSDAVAVARYRLPLFKNGFDTDTNTGFPQ